MSTALSENSAQKKEGRFFPTRLRRGQYLLRCVIWVLVFIVGTFGLIPTLALPARFWIFWGLAVAYKILGCDIPRLKDAGMPPLLLLLFIVPIGNLGLLFILFAAPSKQATVLPPKLDGPATR